MTLCDDGPVGWEALESGVTTSFASNRSLAELASTRCGACASTGTSRSVVSANAATLISRWETGLLRHLDREGMPVPVPIPTTDGRHFADRLVVMTYVEGRSPETEADWRRVANTLRQLHRFTHGWPQRPGWRSSTDPSARRDRDEGRPRRDAA